MDDTLKERMRNHLKKNEGVEAQPYKDTNGNLTVGVGFNVAKKEDFVALKFKTKDAKTGELRDATPEEKTAEYERLTKMDGKAIKADQNRFTLPDGEINSKLDEKIADHEKDAKRQVGEADWSKLTDGQKTAVLDVHYANPGGLDNYPNLKAAIKEGNADKIAAQAGFFGGKDADGNKIRNWEREARNQAEILGVSQEEGRRKVQDKYKDENPKFDGPVAPPKEVPKPVPEPATQPPTNSAPKPEQPPQSSPEPTPEPTPAPPVTTAPPTSEPAPMPVPAPEQKKSEVPADPRAASLVEMASAPIDNPGRAALLKPVEKLTEGEMKDMINHAQGDYRGFRSGDPLKAHTYEKVQDWHVAMYGDAPQANDGGKPIEPQPIRSIPQQASPHTTPDGGDLWQATAKIGQQVADAAGTDGYDNAVKGLQRGLNILNASNPLPGRSPAYGPYTKLGPVEEDGKYGPQTDFALKHATARLGPAKVQDGLALGRFNTFARQAQSSGNADGLEAATHGAFGPLFRDNSDDKSPKVEGGVLQETLNAMGSDLFPANVPTLR
ncbi:MAG: hypothetical protein LDL39_15960 [Magnetospirillum sp.]|nr:hypothetical protein [Magnetospirillum sp.]